MKKKKETSERNISLIRKRKERRRRREKRGNAIIQRDSAGEFDPLLESKELMAGLGYLRISRIRPRLV